MDTSNNGTLGANPFLALFSPSVINKVDNNSDADHETLTEQDPITLVEVQKQQKQITQNSSPSTSLSSIVKDDEPIIVNDVLQRVFLITINEGMFQLSGKNC